MAIYTGLVLLYFYNTIFLNRLDCDFVGAHPESIHSFTVCLIVFLLYLMCV